jgi:hypothetical protein
MFVFDFTKSSSHIQGNLTSISFLWENEVPSPSRRDITIAARGAHPVRGKGRAHPTTLLEGNEPSFSLTGADSRHAVKGDSYVRRASPAAPAEPGAVQEISQRLPARLPV